MRLVPSTLALLAAATAAHAGDLVPTDGRFGPLRVASHRVEVAVDNQIAMTRVEQVFANDHPAQLEAHYVFPVPKGASIIDFSMTVNGKLMRGELLEKGRARQIYEGIVRQSKDPGLLEHVGATIFRVRVFPILPASRQRIELTYLERVNYDGGTCRWTYPLLVPGGAGNTKADLFELRWRLASLVPIRELSCPTHPASTALKTPSAAEVTYEGRQVDLSKDLEITYRIAREKSGMDLAAHRLEKEEEGAFMLLLTPEAGAPRLPKDTTFVFDTSGSMEGKRIRQARAALKFCLAKVGPEDRFNILTFSGDVVAFEKAHVAGTEANRERAAKFVDAIDATGATNINAALLKALDHKAEAARPHLVLFLTDGHPTAGETNVQSIVRNVARANAANVRIFAFGVGENLNRQLLEDLAESTRAVAEFVGEDEDIEEKVGRLQKKVATPVISELSIDWGEADVRHVHPRALGDLFAGTQLMVTGRYRKAGTFEVKLKGRAGAQAVELKQKISFPEKAESPGLPYFWAMRKIAGLLDEIRRHGENAELLSEVVGLSKTYRIATPYTSFLVLETEQAYDQHGVDRKGARWEPPKMTAQAPAPSGGLDPTHVLQPERAEQPRLLPQMDKPRDLDPAKRILDPVVYRKDAVEADHNETADEEEFKRAKGDSLSFVSDKPFKGKGTYDVIGGGAGGGGLYGTRMGGKRNLVARGGGGGDTEDAVLSALKWLSRHQAADGSWKTQGYPDECGKLAKYGGARCVPNPGNEDHDAGNTGLALLAFLGAGYSHLSKDTYDGISFGDAVRKGLQWMMSRQDPGGCIGSRNAQKYMYNHAISALALSEAYGLTGSNLFKDQTQRAIDFLVAAQNPGKGWRYSARCGDNDTSVTAWAMLALKSAEITGLSFPRSAYDGARAWLDEATDEKGRTGYTRAGTGKVFIPGG